MAMALPEDDDPKNIFSNPNELAGDQSADADKERLRRQVRQVNELMSKNTNNIGAEAESLMGVLGGITQKLDQALAGQAGIPGIKSQLESLGDMMQTSDSTVEELSVELHSKINRVSQDLEVNIQQEFERRVPGVVSAIMEQVTPVIDSRARDIQVNIENDVDRLRTVQNRENAEMKVRMERLENLLNGLAAEVQGLRENPVAAIPMNGLTEDEVSKIRKSMNISEDVYYLNTVSIKNFHADAEMREGESPRSFAKRMLAVDATEGIVMDAKNVTVTLTNQSRAIRLTFPGPWQTRRALARVGAAANELRGRDSALVLTYQQLTPPRFGETRKKLNEILMAKKRDNEISSFSFMMVRDILGAKTIGRDGSTQIVKPPGDHPPPPPPGPAPAPAPAPAPDAGVPNDEDEDMDTSIDTQCGICLVSMTEDGHCQRLTCGHGFHINCLKQAFFGTQAKCPTCRATPEPIKECSIDGCADCLIEIQDLQTDFDQPDDPDQVRIDNIRISPKCGHPHLAGCFKKHLMGTGLVSPNGQMDGEQIARFLTSNTPGCRTCSQRPGSAVIANRPTNMFERISFYDDQNVAAFDREIVRADAAEAQGPGAGRIVVVSSTQPLRTRQVHRRDPPPPPPRRDVRDRATPSRQGRRDDHSQRRSPLRSQRRPTSRPSSRPSSRDRGAAARLGRERRVSIDERRSGDRIRSPARGSYRRPNSPDEGNRRYDRSPVSSGFRRAERRERGSRYNA